MRQTNDKTASERAKESDSFLENHPQWFVPFLLLHYCPPFWVRYKKEPSFSCHTSEAPHSIARDGCHSRGIPYHWGSPRTRPAGEGVAFVLARIKIDCVGSFHCSIEFPRRLIHPSNPWFTEANQAWQETTPGMTKPEWKAGRVFTEDFQPLWSQMKWE